MGARTICLSVVAGLVLLGGCGGDDAGGSGPGGGSGPDAGPDGGPDGGVDGGATRSALRTLGDRETFFHELRGALSAQHGGGEYGYVDEDSESVADAGGTGGDDGGAAAPVAETDATADATDGASGADAGTRLEVTETNVQERGVDEQDRVKVSADGRRLYVLHESYDGGVDEPEPIIVEDVESGEAIEVETGDAAIDPETGTSYPAAGPRVTLRVLGLDSDAFEATALRDIELDLGGRGAQGMYLYESDAGSRVVLSSSGGGYWGYWDEPAAFGGLDSVLTRIDVDEPESAAIDGSFRFEGQIVSSRRIGDHLFFASRFYPVVPGPRPYEVSAAEWEAQVQAADPETLLPRYTSGEGAADEPLIDPARCFVAPRPEGAEWYTPDIITLAVVDLATMTLADSECYLGASETLYASPEAVYLATTRWDYGVAVAEEPDVVIVDSDDPISPEDGPVYDPSIETDIHQFDIDDGALAYRGSGNVRGHLGWDELRKPFRMGAKDGFLRVATVNDTWGAEGEVSPINLTVLEPDGNGALARVAEIPNESAPAHIGKPGEQLYASRFLGDRAYLVTFLQTDPLYVIDLADPRAPRIAGELEIEGYSDYLLPLDEDHLLGIGRDAVAVDDVGRGGDGSAVRGGFVQGVKLSLFDVTDPGAPREVESLIVGQRGTESNALYDHRGITVQRATDAHPARVSFGIDVAGRPFPERRPPPTEALTYYQWTHTGLYGFDVRVGDGADIEPRGAMIVERAGEDGYYGPSVYGQDRAVMVNDATYYVHGEEVHVAPWDDLANPAGPR